MKLGVVAIAARTAEKHLAREECFAPKSREPLGVEVPRVDGPEPHDEMFLPWRTVSFVVNSASPAR